MLNAICIALLSIVLAACSGGGGGGGVGGAGGSGGFPVGPELACEPGDLDLSQSTGAGLSVLALGPAVLDQPITAAGIPGFASASFSICVPPDAVSLTLYPDLEHEVLPLSWVGSGIGELVDSSSLDAWGRSVTPELSLPKSPEVPLRPGRHTFVLAATDPLTALPNLAIRRGARSESGSFAFNLVFVDGCGIDASNAAAFDQALQTFQQLYAQPKLTFAPPGRGRIEDPTLTLVTENTFDELTAAPLISDPAIPLIDGVLNVYFVRDIVASGSVPAISLGIPGVPSLLPKRGVVVSVDSHRIDGAIDFGLMGSTLAHEIGHWHGLRHTTERSAMQDLVADTPECSFQNDFDGNGIVTAVECAGTGAENVMFWNVEPSNPPTQLTPGQAFVLQSALTVSPD